MRAWRHAYTVAMAFGHPRGRCLNRISLQFLGRSPHHRRGPPDRALEGSGRRVRDAVHGNEAGVLLAGVSGLRGTGEVPSGSPTRRSRGPAPRALRARDGAQVRAAPIRRSRRRTRAAGAPPAAKDLIDVVAGLGLLRQPIDELVGDLHPALGFAIRLLRLSHRHSPGSSGRYRGRSRIAWIASSVVSSLITVTTSSRSAFRAGPR